MTTLQKPKKLILKSDIALGDIVVMTAAVRDLHFHHPGQYMTDVRTCFPGVWENNPLITPIEDEDTEAERLHLHYPLINHSNQRPYHFIHGYIDDLASKLGLPLSPTKFSGDIHISNLEKGWISQVHEITGFDTPFWIVAAGGKFDYTIKWWSQSRFQEVVDHFQGRILFVQVGEGGHHHPPLKRVLDLRGKTDTRQLIRLMYHSQGVVCPVTSLMHLAAAVETRAGNPPMRPCVVIAGGREPTHWEEYPGHRFLHTIGSLGCCATGGCWRSRTLPIGDGDHKDDPSNLCLQPVGNLPRCMAMVTPEIVIQAVESYLTGGQWTTLTAWQAQKLSPLLGWSPRRTKLLQYKTDEGDNRGNWSSSDISQLTVYNAVAETRRAVRVLPRYPATFVGRGIVMCGGGVRYLPSAWIGLHMLRKLGCVLPIELWHLPSEIPNSVEKALLQIGVVCREPITDNVGDQSPIMSGWQLKSHAILNSSFEEVLYLDADNMAVKNPSYLFDANEYVRTGAIFWPDYGRYCWDDPAWDVCGVGYQDEPEFESGQIVVNKRVCWKALNLAHWYNTNSAFFYRYFMGDKETFHFAFRFLSQEYAMPGHSIRNLADLVMCQHDFAGDRVFQHRNRAKWRLLSKNPTIRGFMLEEQCIEVLAQLRCLWDGRLRAHSDISRARSSSMVRREAKLLTAGAWYLHIQGQQAAAVSLGSNGTIGGNPPDPIYFWNLESSAGELRLTISDGGQILSSLSRADPSSWRGWLTIKATRRAVRLFRPVPKLSQELQITVGELTDAMWAYRAGDGTQRTMTFGKRQEVIAGTGDLEVIWALEGSVNDPILKLSNLENCNVILKKVNSDLWTGHFGSSESSVQLIRIPVAKHGTVESSSCLRTSRAANIVDWSSPWYSKVSKLIKEAPRFHRKQWELVASLSLVLSTYDKGPASSILVISPTSEPIVDALAGCGYRVTWLELGDGLCNEKQDLEEWRTSCYAQLNDCHITPGIDFRRRVSVYHACELVADNISQLNPGCVVWSNFDFQGAQVGDAASAFSKLIAEPNISILALVGDIRLARNDDIGFSICINDIDCLVSHLASAGYQTLVRANYGRSCVETYIDKAPFQDDHHFCVDAGTDLVTSFIVVATKRANQTVT